MSTTTPTPPPASRAPTSVHGLRGLRGRLVENCPLARYTSWRCGGPADRLFVPADRDDLAALLRQLPPEEPVSVLGLGSNVLIRDGGIRGTVILMHGTMNLLEMRGALVFAEAGVPSPKLARFAALHGRGEAEFLAGIPGTVGGGLAMNAGCYGSDTWHYVASVEVLTRAGEFEKRLPSEYSVGYRQVHAAPPNEGQAIFTAAYFAFPPGSPDAARRRIKALLERRVATQPLGLPNAGSVFRNPENDVAARLIDGCGLKGLAVGAARVSEKHANFIVNPGGKAKAADIEAIIERVRAVVLERTGVRLHTEVEILGEATR